MPMLPDLNSVMAKIGEVKYISMGIPITLVMIMLIYASLTGYANCEKLNEIEPIISTHLIEGAGRDSFIATKLDMIDRRLSRIESLLDARSVDK